MTDGLGSAFSTLRLTMWFGDGEVTTKVWSDSRFRPSTVASARGSGYPVTTTPLRAYSSFPTCTTSSEHSGCSSDFSEHNSPTNHRQTTDKPPTDHRIMRCPAVMTPLSVADHALWLPGLVPLWIPLLSTHKILGGDSHYHSGLLMERFPNFCSASDPTGVQRPSLRTRRSNFAIHGSSAAQDILLYLGT